PPMNLAVGLQPDQQPEHRNDHVTVYEERFEPLTSAFALSAIVVGIAQEAHRTVTNKLELDGAVVAQIPAPARARTRIEVASPETSHAKSAL
ncbi:MAG TPA: hypothetical protein VKB71_18900, partial [Rhizomicrobium sp.]|nr:hypothetical protein [Rhizomicrobium sp.]